jgi:hypothetical protein
MKKIILLILFFLLENCYSKIVEFNLLSTRNSNIDRWEKFPQRVTGISCTNVLLFFPVSFKDLKDAIDNAIDKSNKESKKNNEALIDVKIYTFWWTIFLYSRSCYEVEGKPANSWGEKNYL